MIDLFLEKEILSSIEKSRKEAEAKFKLVSYQNPYAIFEKILNLDFTRINNFHRNLDDKYTVACVNKVVIEKKEIDYKDHAFGKSILGSSLIIAGQPILKKRFIMKGSATGTSIASKYLSKALPQKLPVRILGTTVVGRAIGRIVPYVGWTLVAIEIIEIVFEYCELNKKDKAGFNGGFKGGSFSGGGSRGRW